MEFAPAGINLSCEVTYDSPDLYVGMSVYDDTGDEPVLLLSPFAMVNVAHNTYRGKFAAVAGRAYIVIKGVYTDDTFTTLSDDYSQGSESIVAQNLTLASLGCSVIGYVENNLAVIGRVVCD